MTITSRQQRGALDRDPDVGAATHDDYIEGMLGGTGPLGDMMTDHQAFGGTILVDRSREGFSCSRLLHLVDDDEGIVRTVEITLGLAHVLEATGNDIVHRKCAERACPDEIHARQLCNRHYRRVLRIEYAS